MLLRRSLITALSLTMFGNVPLVAQQKDPFAEWDRENARTQSKARTAAPQAKAASSDKTTMTYFSANGLAETSTADNTPGSTGASTTVPMREKTPLRQQVEQLRGSASTHEIAPQATAARPLSTPVAINTPVPNSKASKSPAAGLSSPTQSPSTTSSIVDRSGVRNAAFNSDVESNGNPAIETVSGGVGGDSNKTFEDFVNSAATVSRPEVPAFDGRDDSELELAEPLFNPAAATARKSSVPASSPTLPARPDAGPQSPGVTVQWVKHGGFNVGQVCDVELVVKNTSQTIVGSVMAEAIIPATVEIVDARPAAVEGTDAPTWTFGELQPGQSQSVMLKVIPQTSGDVRMEAYVRLTGSTSSQFSVQEPMIGVAVTGPEKVEIGQQVGYLVRVSNPGTGLANNVIIQAAVPEGLEHRNGSLLTIEIGTLNPGESRQARLSLTAIQGGNQQLAVRALADGGLADQTTTAIVVAEPQLAIAIAGPQEPVAGRSANYTLTVSNSGNVQSANVRAKYRIPDGFSFVSADRGGKYVEIDKAVEWFVGTLQPNDTSDFVVTMKANKTGELIHQAGVISEHGHITACELATQVKGSATLELKIAANQREIRIGDEIRWEIQVQNTGSREASNVGVSCELPAGFELIEANGPTNHIAENGVLVFRSIPAIEAGTSATIIIHGRCNRDGNQRLRLRVASESVNEVLIGEEFATVSR